MALPEAATKLRIVLDYLPCEACLAQPTADQELLCTVCARLHRQIAVRAATRTSVIVERPSPPEAPVVIPAAPAPVPEPPAVAVEAAAPAAPPPKPIVVRFADEPAPAGDVVDVVVEAVAPPPAPVAFVAPAPLPLVAKPEPADEPEFDDLVSFSGARDEFFDYSKPVAEAAEPRLAPEPEPQPVSDEPFAQIEDDFVFRPPARESPPPAPVEEPAEEIAPTEEIPVEAEGAEQSLWAPPPDFLAEEAAAETVVEEVPVEPMPPEEEIVEMEVEPEPEVVEMEIVEDEPTETEIVEMEVIEDEPAAPPASGSDLYRLRGFDARAEGALARAGITQITHLSGHDAGELAERTGLPFERVASWIQVADLVQEVGVPVDPANTLVHAGIQGPRGLREAEPEEIVDRIAAFAPDASISEREIKRWKRRA